MRKAIRIHKIVNGGKSRIINIPREAEELLGITVGMKVMIYVDTENKELIAKLID